MVEKSADYWVQVGAGLETRPPDDAWRAYCDGLNRGWLAQHLGCRRFRRALKTDLFDEAAGASIGPMRAELFVGIDVAASTARLARRKGVEALAADVRRLPFCDGAFDLIVSLSTLDHFSDAAEISKGLVEIRRVLAPGGVLALTLDNLSNPYIRLRNLLPWALLRRSRLVPYFVGATLTRPRLEEVLAAAGFRVVNISAMMHAPRVLMVPLVGKIRSPGVRRMLEACERLGRLPTRYRTGLYLAVIAEST